MNDLLHSTLEYAPGAADAAYVAANMPEVTIGAEGVDDTAYDTTADPYGSYADADTSGQFGSDDVPYDHSPDVVIDASVIDEAPDEPPTDNGGGTPPDDTGNTPPPGGSDEYPAAGEPDDGEGHHKPAPYLPPGVVVIDMTKTGDYPARLAEILAADGVPDKMATVHLIEPGEGDDTPQNDEGNPDANAEPAPAGGEGDPARTIRPEDMLKGTEELISGGSGKTDFMRRLSEELDALGIGTPGEEFPATPATVEGSDTSPKDANEPFGGQTAAEQLADLPPPDGGDWTKPPTEFFPKDRSPLDDTDRVIDRYVSEALDQARAASSATGEPQSPSTDALKTALDDLIAKNPSDTTLDQWREMLNKGGATVIDLGPLPPEARRALVAKMIEQVQALGGRAIIDEPGSATGNSVNESRSTSRGSSDFGSAPLTNTPNVFPLRTGDSDDSQRLASTMGAPTEGPSYSVNTGTPGIPTSPFGGPEAVTPVDIAGLSDGEVVVVSGDGEPKGVYDIHTGERRDSDGRDPRDEPWGTQETAAPETYGDAGDPNAAAYEARNTPAPGTENNGPNGGGVGQN
jgi:hypothetical protein